MGKCIHFLLVVTKFNKTGSNGCWEAGMGKWLWDLQSIAGAVARVWLGDAFSRELC